KDPAALVKQGQCYEYGKEGVERDLKEAVKYYRLAAADPDPKKAALGQGRLGSCYEHGKGVEQNIDEAVRYYKLAAEKGDAFGQVCLGQWHLNTYELEQDEQKNLKYGLKPDPKEAIRLFSLAVEQKYRPAYTELAVCYRDGEVVEVNIK